MLKRRDILMLGGGSVAALPFTPLPWKLLDDVSIWTQNWPWIPTPEAGAISVKNTVCTLCRGGCAVGVRCVDTRPIGVAPRRDAEGNVSPACALAMGAHQLPWHPSRLRASKLNGKTATAEEVAASVAKACKEAKPGTVVAVLDERPGRAMSSIYRRFAASIGNGVYVTPAIQETATLDAVRALGADAKANPHFDWEQTKTVLSVGAPLLDGWPGAAPLLRRWGKGEVRVLHAGSTYSRQAQLAERFIPLTPGSEGAFALGLASALMGRESTAEGLREFESMAARFPLERAAALTGLKPETFKELAVALTDGAPAIVVGGGDHASGPLDPETETLIAAVNVLLGSVGREGGIVNHAASPIAVEVHALSTVADKSIAVLIADRAACGCALPWSAIAQKLAKDAVVVALSAWDTGTAARAQVVVATPAPMEDWSESASPVSYAVAPAVLTRPEGTLRADELLTAVAAALDVQSADGFALDNELKRLAAKLHATKRGSLTGADGTSRKVSEVASAEDCWKTLSAGGSWTDESGSPTKLPVSLPGRSPEEMEQLLAAVNRHGFASRPAEYPLALIATGWAAAGGDGALPPLTSKVDVESLLRRPGGRAAMHPLTAGELGLKNGDAVKVQSEHGEWRPTLVVDDTVLPNAVEVVIEDQASRGALALFTTDENGTWRHAWARVGRS